MTNSAHFGDSVRFNPGGSLTPGANSRFAGFPVGVQIDSDCFRQITRPGDPTQREALIENPAAPAVGDGTLWRSTAYGGGATFTWDMANSPPVLILTTGATENDGVQFQAVGGAGQSDRIFRPARFTRAWFEMVIRIRDANNNETTTLQECEFFAGLAQIDTDVLATATDFVGMHKPDGSSQFTLVSDDDSAATLDLAGAKQDFFDIANFSTVNDGSAAVNELIKIGFVLDKLGTDQGLMYGYVENGATGKAHKQTMVLGANVPDNAMCPTFTFDNGESTAKILDVALIHYGFDYPLGTAL